MQMSQAAWNRAIPGINGGVQSVMGSLHIGLWLCMHAVCIKYRVQSSLRQQVLVFNIGLGATFSLMLGLGAACAQGQHELHTPQTGYTAALLRFLFTAVLLISCML